MPPNIIHLDATVDEARKQAFVRTCDAMLHARRSGETFGLACAEFSAHNKPVITSSVHHDGHFARFHIDALGAKGLFYHDEPSCEKLLLTFDRKAAQLKDWNAYRPFEPEKVMATFRKVFLEPGLPGSGDELAERSEQAACSGEEDEAKRTYQQLQGGGARMPCYGK